MKTILIIDDDQSQLDLMTEYFCGLDYNIIQTTDSDEALQLSKSVNPDLIITDMVMPGTGGREIIHQVKKTSKIPIVAVSGYRNDLIMATSKICPRPLNESSWASSSPATL